MARPEGVNCGGLTDRPLGVTVKSSQQKYMELDSYLVEKEMIRATYQKPSPNSIWRCQMSPGWYLETRQIRVIFIRSDHICFLNNFSEEISEFSSDHVELYKSSAMNKVEDEDCEASDLVIRMSNKILAPIS